LLSVTPSPTDQVHTAPHLKWLLNERAMLCGEVALRQRTIDALQAEQGRFTQRIRALDEVMAMFSPQLNPGAAGVVRAIKGKYGPRGGLLAFVLEQLWEAGALGVDTRALTERAAVKFGVALDSPAARKRFKDTMLWTLRYQLDKGVIEVVHDSRGGHVPKVWRIAQVSGFQALLAEKEAVDG
jgi:hypothetical protein